ncbi:MAG: N-acetylmuramoyl-L-alanine amidase, partial [Aquiluna sp.]
MKWNPQVLITAAQRAGVNYEVDGTWLKVDPYPKGFSPVGVVWHHTACGTFSKGNMPSLNWCRFPGQYSGQARACHIVVGRDGQLQIIAGRGAYHAGGGGPLKVNGTNIPRDLGNRFLLGIEIEASSTSKINKKNKETPKSGMNPAQFVAVAKYCAALFDELDWETDAAIRHKDWAPGRKVDVGIPLKSLREEIDKYRKKSGHPQPEEPDIKPITPPVVKLSNIKFRKRHDHV